MNKERIISSNNEEISNIVDNLNDPSEFEDALDGFNGPVPEVENAQSGDALRLWPHQHDTDGMYLALLRRAVGSANEPATEPVDG